LEAELTARETELASLEKEVIVKTKTLEMLPKAGENAEKLQQVVNGSARKLEELGIEWEKHRLPLISQLRTKRDSASGRKARCKAMVEEMKKCRVEMQAMANEVRVKEEAMKLLSEELAKMPKNVNRTLYTYRIMDIISSIAKQKKEIDKIILEIANVQKDINATGEKLHRAEALADEKIFSTAKLEANKKDAAMVDAYRHFSDIRAKFDELVTCISDIGKRETDARNLETKTEQLAERVSKNNTERILNDLKQVQEENAGLVNQIRSLKK
jgi:coiled-coil domain-containing protein 22